MKVRICKKIAGDFLVELPLSGNEVINNIPRDDYASFNVGDYIEIKMMASSTPGGKKINWKYIDKTKRTGINYEE